MPSTARSALYGLILCLLSGIAVAQATLTVPINLVAGDVVSISYTDASRAGQTITVKIAGGYPETIEYLDIHLDADGKGSASWKVRDWASAHFNAPGVTEIYRLID